MTQPQRGRSVWSRAQFGISYLHETRNPQDQNVLNGISDPWGSGSLYLTRLGQSGRLLVGRIVYALPYLNWYRVLVEEAGDIACLHVSSDTTLGPLGPRSISMLPPGSLVLLFRHPTDPMGYIIGSIPELTEDGRLLFSDWISQGSGTGYKREGYYDEVIGLVDDGVPVDLNCSRPQDATVFDWGRSSGLGGMLQMDPFMMQLRMSEMCGMTLHYIDELTRITGRQLDVVTSGSERAERDDEGEYTMMYGETPYPWEAMGVFDVNGTATRDVDAADVQYNEHEGAIEPKEADQIPFYRYREFGGYLGQGRIREMLLPPKDVETWTLEEQEKKAVTVFREHISLDGSATIATAGSWTVAKRPFMGTVKQLKQPEDATGDHTENYLASGVTGVSDAEHIVGTTAGAPDAGDGPPQHLLSASALMQQHVYAFNWKPLVGFHYHTKDWIASEESDSPLHEGYEKPALNKLATQQWMDAPRSVEYKVDDRYGEAKFYQILSHISITDEGFIQLATGEGSSITLGAGNVEITCPGDFVIKTGRSVIQVAGDDVVVKARNSIDVTSTDKDVRIKAENNMQMVSNGGVLVESKAEGNTHTYKRKFGEDVRSSGVVIRAANSHVSAMSKDMYLRTGVATQDGGEGTAGDIVIDAGKGKADVKMVGKNFVRHVGGEANDYFGIENPIRANKFGQGYTRLAGSLEVNGDLRAKGQLTVETGIVVTAGHIATSQAGNTGKVSQLRNPSAQTSLNQVAQRASQLVQTAATHWKEKINELFYANNKIGSDDLQKLIEFSFRNEKQYRTTDFKIIQAPWQRLAGDDLEFWTEKQISTQSEKLMPWPGYKRWAEDEAFYDYETKLYDEDTGLAKDRTEPDYEDKELGAWKEPTKLDGKYPVIPA